MPNRADDLARTESPIAHPSDGLGDYTVLAATPACALDGTSGRYVAYGGVAALDCGAADHAVRGDLVRDGSNWGLIARVAGANDYYLLYIDSGLSIVLYKNVAGSFTVLATSATAAVLGHRYELAVSGTTITGADVTASTDLFGAVSDGSLTTGTLAGFRLSGSNDAFLADLAITVASPPPPPATTPYLTLLGVG